MQGELHAGLSIVVCDLNETVQIHAVLRLGRSVDDSVDLVLETERDISEAKLVKGRPQRIVQLAGRLIWRSYFWGRRRVAITNVRDLTLRRFFGLCPQDAVGAICFYVEPTTWITVDGCTGSGLFKTAVGLADPFRFRSLCRNGPLRRGLPFLGCL